MTFKFRNDKYAFYKFNVSKSNAFFILEKGKKTKEKRERDVQSD